MCTSLIYFWTRATEQITCTYVHNYVHVLYRDLIVRLRLVCWTYKRYVYDGDTVMKMHICVLHC